MLRNLLILWMSAQADLDAATITAATCSQASVASAVASASPGDTVAIPAGTCSWTSPLTITKGITLQGAGQGVTIIEDHVGKGDANCQNGGAMIIWSVNSPAAYRMTGLTIRGVAADPYVCSRGHVVAGGTTKAFRVDHITIDPKQTAGIVVQGDTYGVIDHSTFSGDFKNSVQVKHMAWGGGQYGDRSWTEPIHWGTEKAVYIEDNTFINTNADCLQTGFFDSYGGGRAVIRRNSARNVGFASHGTDTSQRIRSQRQMEVYDNTFTFGDICTPPNIGWIRGGTGVVFNNTATAPAGTMGSLVSLVNCRDTGAGCGTGSSSFAPWGACDGTSVFDGNTPGESGYRCIDQPGAGTSVDLLGQSPPPDIKAQNVLDPVYIWNNQLRGVSNNSASPSMNVRLNRDYYSGAPRPGYVPYVYPHPLVSGAAVPPPPPPPPSGTVTAASCGREDVQAAVNAAPEGATVMIPAGTCSWTSTLVVPAKAITISGAGVGQTIIIDDVARSGPNQSSMSISTVLGKPLRLTAFTLRGGSGGIGYGCSIGIDGTSRQVRVDHIHFLNVNSCSLLLSGWIYGVVDHNTFDLGVPTANGQFLSTIYNGVRVNHRNWNGASYGDGSWADESYFGSEKAVFLEDNVFNNGAATDIDHGGRMVFRRNRLTNAFAQGHNSANRYTRAARLFEVYQNTFTWIDAENAAFNHALYIRSGTGNIWGNKVRGFVNMVTAINDRSTINIGTWGLCNGSNPWDQNSQPDGYACLDQIGRGKGDLLTGDPPVNSATGMASWPRQAAEPFYVWGNDYAPPAGYGGARLWSSFGTVIQEGRDYIVGSSRPGYSPYTYPHPLVTGAAAPPPPPPAPPPPPPPAAPGLTAWWKIDDASGAAAADSIGSQNAALVNGPTWTAGRAGGALSFDGFDDHLQTGAFNVGSQQFTVSVWVRKSTTTSGNVISQQSAVFQWGLAAGDRVLFYTDQSGWLLGNPSNIGDGRWHHAAVTHDGTATRIYQDGVLQAAGSGGYDASALNAPLLIGRWQSGHFAGFIDDVRIYNRALSAVEIQQLFDSYGSPAGDLPPARARNFRSQ